MWPAFEPWWAHPRGEGEEFLLFPVMGAVDDGVLRGERDCTGVDVPVVGDARCFEGPVELE